MQPGRIKQEIKSIFYIILIAIVIRSLLIEPFFVPTGSMKPTILPGDYVFGTKYNYGYSRYSFPFSIKLFEGRILSTKPMRGDIIIFRPPYRMEDRFIKRLIGLPGDKIQFINGVIHINDQPVKREFLEEFVDEGGSKYHRYLETLPNGLQYCTISLAHDAILTNRYDNTGPFFIPENEYFFIGDNRDESTDSRSVLGFVPGENLIAKAQIIHFSAQKLLFVDRMFSYEQLQQIFTWLGSIRKGRIMTFLYSDPKKL